VGGLLGGCVGSYAFQEGGEDGLCVGGPEVDSGLRFLREAGGDCCDTFEFFSGVLLEEVGCEIGNELPRFCLWILCQIGRRRVLDFGRHFA